jgi:hypothetical protein
MGGKDTFKKDDQFSKHKDYLLAPFWGSKAYEGRFIIVGSKKLQKVQGADVILEGKNGKDVIIDTKHVRGKHKSFYLEEESCPAYGTPGWILKEDGWPDYIVYCFWSSCKGCYEDCEGCRVVKKLSAYAIKFEELREWFLKNKDKYFLHQNAGTINKTTGRLVSIKELSKHIYCIKVKVKTKRKGDGNVKKN